MSLVIVESPAKCQKIQSYLGKGWKVIASLGHIRGLEQNLNFLKTDFEPKYEYLKEKAKAIAQLKEEAKKADTVYLAADRDFEGEQIAYSVCLLLKLNPKKTHRITFTEITEKAVKNAIDNPGFINMNRVHTQQSRAMLDLLLGFTMSPLLWRYVAPSLSAGRCQIPSLRLVVEREDAINNFKVSSSWSLYATFNGYNATMEDELEDEESVQNYMENIYQTPDATILTKTIKKWSESAPQPLITSTLQQQASALYGSNPKATMRSAQRLYEAGHITYMRTDKAVLSEEAKSEAIAFVTEEYGVEFVNNDANEERKRKKNDEEKKAQEAHEAIRPTHMEVREVEGEDRKIYALIWQRTIQSVMAAARGETCRVQIQIAGDTDFTWRTESKRTVFEGWKCAGKIAVIDDEEENADSDWSILNRLNIGDKIQWIKITAEPKDTKAHGRYTEATLVRELERHGIGRPSTFASLLSVIQEKNYVEHVNIPSKDILIKEYIITPHQWPPSTVDKKKKVGAEKNKLVPTELGRSVLAFILQHFDDLFQYNFTSHMEKRLDAIAEGTDDWKEIIKTTWDSYKDRFTALSQDKPETSTKKKEFKNGLKAVQTRKGPLLLIEGDKTEFLGWPKGITFEDMTEEVALQFMNISNISNISNNMGEWNSNPIIKKSGKFGDYLQCGMISIPFIADEEHNATIERLEAKQNTEQVVFKNYTIRTGKYGPYIMKTSVKKAVFVSLPKDIDMTKLTEKEVDAIYKMGIEAKKSK